MEGFEAVSVLESDDGLGYTREREVRPDELANHRSNQPTKSLRDQLAENKERADTEWQISHNPHQPPAQLADDEREFIKDEINQSINQRNQLKKQEADEFEQAKLRLKSKSASTAINQAITVDQPINQSSTINRPNAVNQSMTPTSATTTLGRSNVTINQSNIQSTPATVSQSNNQSISQSLNQSKPVVVSVKRKSEACLPDQPIKRAAIAMPLVAYGDSDSDDD